MIMHINVIGEHTQTGQAINNKYIYLYRWISNVLFNVKRH